MILTALVASPATISALRKRAIANVDGTRLAVRELVPFGEVWGMCRGRIALRFVVIR
jgi:hypothetical protein